MGLAIDVDTDWLRGCASALDDTSTRVGAVLLDVSSLVIAAPGWAATAATDAAQTATGRQLMLTAEAVRSTGQSLSAAATGYDSADERAAGRLRGAR